MTPPIEARIERAIFAEPPKLAKAIARRGLKEAYAVQNDMRQLQGEPPITNTATPYDRYLIDTTARAAMVYLPQPDQTDWTPDFVPDYLTFSRTRLRVLPDVDTLAWAHIPLEDLGNPHEEAAAQEVGKNINKVLRGVFEGGGIFVPPFGSVTELIKMQQTAHNIVDARYDSHAISDRVREHAVLNVYIKDDPYEVLQKEYYRTPDQMALVGISSINQITGATMAKYEIFKWTGELPGHEEAMFVADRHEEQAATQRADRTRVLMQRINTLWPSSS
jgi:hypothetical protein